MKHRTLLFAALLAFVLLSGTASAKSYSLDKAELYYKVMPDGLVEAREEITFDFSGSFSYAYRDIPNGEWQLSDIKVYDTTAGREALPFTVSLHGSDRRIQWNFSAEDESRTFSVEYRLSNAVRAYDDVAEFYWKVWGEGWDHRLAELYGEIELPGQVRDAKEVYSWGHPEVNGKIGLLDNRKLIFQAFGIPAGQFVEIRTVFPVELLESRENAVQITGQGLESIVAEEKAWAEENNFDFGYFLGLLLALVLAEAVLFATVWYKWGREPRVELQAIYEREIPYKYSPAAVKALMEPLTRKPTLECITAEILDLCLKGKLKIRPLAKKKFLGIFGQDNFEIRVLDRSLEGLPKSERMVFGLISDAAETAFEGFLFKRKVRDSSPEMVTLEQLQKYLMHDRRKSVEFGRKWQKQVKRQAEMQGFFSKKTAYLPFIAGTAAVIILALASALTIAPRAMSLAFFLPIAPIVVLEAVILAVAFPDALPNRTRKGALHHKKWTLLKKFLNDFSNLKEMPPDAIVLWEQYLVYSIPLGVAKKVQKAMDHAFEGMKGEYKGHIFAGSYASFSAAGIGSIAGSFSTAFASAAGTSGGGGFGGAGGAGGGGGGGGAG